MHELLSDSSAMRFLPDIKTETPAQTEKNLETAVAESLRGEFREKYFFAVVDKQGTYLGDIGYTVYNRSPEGEKNGHLGYFFLERYWGQGFATEAVQAVLSFAFSEDHVLKIETGCAKDNIGSERVMVKCGFIKEAEKRNHEWIDGVWRDRVEYGLLRKEWFSRK